jgi:hypothetical protein
MMITRQISTLKELEPAAITDPIEARIRADGYYIINNTNRPLNSALRMVSR